MIHLSCGTKRKQTKASFATGNGLLELFTFFSMKTMQTMCIAVNLNAITKTLLLLSSLSSSSSLLPLILFYRLQLSSMNVIETIDING